MSKTHRNRKGNKYTGNKNHNQSCNCSRCREERIAKNRKRKRETQMVW